jgi:hypothetical protein
LCCSLSIEEGEKFTVDFFSFACPSEKFKFSGNLRSPTVDYGIIFERISGIFTNLYSKSLIAKTHKKAILTVALSLIIAPRESEFSTPELDPAGDLICVFEDLQEKCNNE